MGAAGTFSITPNYGSGVGAGIPGVSFINPTDPKFVSSSNPANQLASDATVKVDGISYTRNSNTLTDVVPGLTLNLKTITSGITNIDLTRDNTGIKDKMTAFVTAYNDAVTMLNAVSDPKSTLDTYGATLVNDTAVRSIKQQLRAMVMGQSSTPGKTVGALWQMGVSVDIYGVMTLDSTKLDTALNNNYADVVKTFTGNQNGLSIYSTAPAGIAGDAVKTITNMLGKTGILQTQTDSANTQNTKYKDDLTKLQTRMDALLLRYQKQFSAMDSLVGSVNTQKTSLKSTFDGMMASLTGKSG
jgi:flagellar hook-associated protein 2